jgi:uncharacterized protein (DUF849 family)
MIVQFSTGGRGRDQAARGAMLDLRPDMASLATGLGQLSDEHLRESARFRRAGSRGRCSTTDIKPEVEVFDLAMLYNAGNLVEKGLIKDKPHVQFVMGIPNAMPMRPSVFNFLRSELADVLPGANVGRGGHRTLPVGGEPDVSGGRRTLPDGLEDNTRFDATRLAASNAELVRKIVDACELYDRRPASAG